MEDKTLTTTNGYIVTLAPFLTYDQFIDIQKIWTKDVVIDPNDKDESGVVNTPKPGKISANLMYEANKMAVGFLVKKIVDPKGVEMQRVTPDSLPIPAADGQEVTEAINKISDEAAAAFDKKKVTSE